MQRNTLRTFLLLPLTLLLLAALGLPAWAGGNIVVANRISGDISVIDADTDAVTNLAMPVGANASQPMYVFYSAGRALVFVGDRANNRVVAFRASDFSVETTLPAGNGVFHMWGSDAADQLWVNNDIDKTVTVIDTVDLSVITTIPTPADLVALGGKPHDVIVEPNAPYAYVTMLGIAGPNDFVVKYSTDTFQEIGRQAVGQDPHLSLARQSDLLYVPCQNSNAVFVLDRATLALMPSIPVASAHGAGMSRNGKSFYTTNIAGGGVDALVEIDTKTNTVVDAWDTTVPTPHNIALTPNGKKIYITHSGAIADAVSIFTRKNKNQPPSLAAVVTVGQNPFGLAYVP
jgi:DNA-binding beta-propeller fold protein YncE